MTDFLYRPEDVDDDVRPIFDHLVNEFGDHHQIWRQIENLGRWLSAGILDPATGVAVTIAIRTATGTRNSTLSEAEILQIHKHFASGIQQDLAF